MNISIKYFTAPWCGPCRMFGPVVEKVTGELGVPLHKINVDDSLFSYTCHIKSAISLKSKTYLG